MLKFKIFFLYCLLFSGIACAGELFGAEEFYLDNGMRVIVVPNHRVPVIKHMVWYGVGAADEKIGKGGTAHLLEHLMFRGTKDVPGQKFNVLMEENGAESNAFTAQDMTAYHQLADVSRLELVMALEADRMNNLDIKESDFVVERDIVFQERKQRVDNNPMGKFREALNRILWQQHPYSRPVTGTDEEIMSLQKADLLEYYKKYYVPNNAVLVLAGDIDVSAAKKLAQKYYGSLPKKDFNVSDWGYLNTNYSAKLNMQDKDIKGLRIFKIHAAPSFVKEVENVYGLILLAEYMGGGETSKLYKKLVLRNKKLLSIDVSYDPVARSYGQFSIYMIPNNGVSEQEALLEFNKAWAESLSELNDDEVNKTKQKMLAELVYLRDNPEDAAYIVGSMAVSGMKLEDIENYKEKLKQVSYKDMYNAAKYLENNTPNVIGVLAPVEKF